MRDTFQFQTIDDAALASVSGGAFDFSSLFKHGLFGAVQGGLQSLLSEFLGQFQSTLFPSAAAAAPSAAAAQGAPDQQQPDAAAGE